jgi:Flp pilus assembly protein TadD
MKKNMFTVSLVSITLLVPLVALQHSSVASAVVLSFSSQDVETSAPAQPKKSGKSFVRALSAPFKALSKIFGRKKNDQRAHNVTEKDIKKFESAQVTRINDASAKRPAVTTGASSANDHLQRGRDLLNAGYLNEAIAELSLAASIDAQLSEAHNLLAVAYQGKGLTQLSRTSFEMAMKIDKDNPEILNNMGYLLYLNGDYTGAMERLKKAVRLDPDNALILNNLALAQSQLGKFDEAYKNFARAGGEIVGRVNIAKRLELAGRRDEALKYFEAAKRQAETEQKANPTAQAITVVMEVKNGLITFASVKNHRQGLEDYEASALRLARQRRYPANKTGQEFVVVKVSPPPAS